MNLLIPIILQLAGVGVIMAEIFLPSGGILSILALGVFGYSLYMVFTEISVAAGMVFVAADLVMIPVLVLAGLKLLARSPASLRRELSRDSGVTSQAPEMRKLMGKQGPALTDLRPSGMARLNGARVDVVTRGEYIEKGVNVVVVKVTGNQVVVKRGQ